MGRHHIEGGVNGLHLRHGVGDAPVGKDLAGVPHLNDDVILALLVPVGDARHIVGHAEVLGQNGDLECADLVGDVAVPGDGVRRGGEHIDVLPFHGVGHHVVRDDGGVKSHLGEAAGGQPGALEIGPGLRAEHPEILVLLPRRPHDRADDGLAEALGQNGAVVGDELRQPVAHDLHGAVPAVQGLHRVFHDGADGVLSLGQGLGRHIHTAVGDLAVTVCGSGPGVGQVIGGLLQKGHLLRLRLVPHLPGGQGHAHAHGGVRTGALGHHVGDGLGHLPVIRALHEADLCGIDPAVQNADLAIVIPCHVLVLQQEGHVIVHAYHIRISFIVSMARKCPSRALFRQTCRRFAAVSRRFLAVLSILFSSFADIQIL